VRCFTSAFVSHILTFDLKYWISLHYIILHYVTLHYITLYYIALHAYTFHRFNICPKTFEYETSHKYIYKMMHTEFIKGILMCVRTSNNTKTTIIIEIEYKILDIKCSKGI